MNGNTAAAKNHRRRAVPGCSGRRGVTQHTSTWQRRHGKSMHRGPSGPRIDCATSGFNLLLGVENDILADKDVPNLKTDRNWENASVIVLSYNPKDHPHAPGFDGRPATSVRFEVIVGDSSTADTTATIVSRSIRGCGGWPDSPGIAG